MVLYAGYNVEVHHLVVITVYKLMRPPSARHSICAAAGDDSPGEEHLSLIYYFIPSRNGMAMECPCLNSSRKKSRYILQIFLPQ